MPESDLQKHTFHLYEGDYKKVQDLYPELGAAIVIRSIVRKFLIEIESGLKVPTLQVQNDELSDDK